MYVVDKIEAYLKANPIDKDSVFPESFQIRDAAVSIYYMAMESLKDDLGEAVSEKEDEVKVLNKAMEILNNG